MQPVTSESETDEDDLFSIVEELKVWANKFEIKQNALDDLLKILKGKGFEDVLPTCARTLLKTPRTVVMNTVSDMHYYHFGLKYMLEHRLQSVSKEKLEGIQCLVLSLNIDGLPLFKSSNTSVWAVLCSISNIKRSHVFPISFSVGTHKPSNLDFLNDVVTDLGELFTSGLVFDGKHLQISISCIICDAPAKAFVKNTKLYCGYYGCDKCMQRGVYIGRMTYQDVSNLTLRKDESFRSQSQVEHHKGLSPVTQLPVDMIKQFPIDYMHQVCLGVVKRLILLWMRGPRADFRLSAVLVGQISENLISMRKFIPKEFVRKPRSLIEIDRWKATEFRQFLLYTGAFVLKDVLEPIYYRNFLALTEHSDYAQDLLEWFVERGRELYGREFLVYNVHMLVHLKDDACQFGSLENCAAWKFENYMQRLKRKVRCGNQPAVQLVKRVQEELLIQSTYSVADQNRIYCSEPNNAFQISENNNYKFCEIQSVCLNDKRDATGRLNQKRKILREEIPDKKVWDLFDCRIVGKSVTLGDVVAMKKAEVTSNLESFNEDSAAKRSRKRPHRYAANAEESSEDDKMFVPEKQPKLVQKKDEKINSQEKIPKTPLYKNVDTQGHQQNSNLERQLPSTSSGEGQRSSTSSGEGKRPSTSSGEGQGSSSSSGLLQMPSTSSGKGKRPSTSSIERPGEERTPDMDLPVIDRPSSRLSLGDSAVMRQMQKDVTDIKKAVTTILNTLIVQEEVVVESVEDFIPEKIKNQEMMDQLNEQLESDEEFRKKLVRKKLTFITKITKKSMQSSRVKKKGSHNLDHKCYQSKHSICIEFSINLIIINEEIKVA
ncbi:unnamed protein product [Mytilus coruscus]|uniref:Transposase domain-containing protein n=1 Tax=Mytilus coruscus TaxID=42192 RepID=A0A6J8BJW9_MYTCO|nr:unnamed protein product [Mytilus coruscus]